LLERKKKKLVFILILLCARFLLEGMVQVKADVLLPTNARVFFPQICLQYCLASLGRCRSSVHLLTIVLSHHFL